MFCPKCGTRLKDEMQFCPKCGQAVPTQNENWEESEIWYDSDYPDYLDYPEEPKRKVWPFVLIGIALLLAAASVAIYFTVLRPRQDASVISEKNTEQRAEAANEQEITTAAQTTTAQTTTAQTTTAASFPKVMYATATDGLLLRTGPGQQNAAIYLILYGRQITVEKTENGWAYTTVDGVTGWCSMKYLTENKNELQ